MYELILIQGMDSLSPYVRYGVYLQSPVSASQLVTCAHILRDKAATTDNKLYLRNQCGTKRAFHPPVESRS